MSAIDRLRAAGLAGDPVTHRPDVDVCSCGRRDPHVIAYRDLADGTRLGVWSDGSLTQMGVFLRGLGAPRSSHRRRVRARAVRAVMDDLSLFDSREVPRLVKIAEETFKHSWSSEADRRTSIRIRALRGRP